MDSVAEGSKDVQTDQTAPYGFATASLTARGRVWTVAAGLLTFAAILTSVWFYLYPRLSGEPLSAAAKIELRSASADPRKGFTLMNSPDGKSAWVSSDVGLSAADVLSFRGYGDSDGTPVLQLNLNPSGVSKLAAIRKSAGTEWIALLINDKLLFVYQPAPDDATTSGMLVLRLRGIPREEAEEAFARLTQ